MSEATRSTARPTARAALVRTLAGVCLAGTLGPVGLWGMSGCQMLDRWAQGSGRPRAAQPPLGTQAPVHLEDTQDAARGGPVRTEELIPGVDELTRARVLQQQGLSAEALQQFEAAIEENPLLTAAYMGSADILREQGNFEEAETRYGRAAQLEPRNFDAQYWHAVVLQELRRWDESIRAYLRALALRPDDFRANANLGTTYLQAGEPQQALPYSVRAVELNPEDGPARTNLGAVYSALGRHEDAITEFQQAAELTELTPPLLLNLADSYGRVRRYEEMVSTLEQVIRLEPSAIAYERLGSGLFRLRDFDGALDNFRRAVELDPTHFPAHNGIGVCLLNRWALSDEQDQAARDEGLRALRRSLQIERNQPRVLELLSRYQ